MIQREEERDEREGRSEREKGERWESDEREGRREREDIERERK